LVEGIYEMDFPEGPNMKVQGDSDFPFAAIFVFTGVVLRDTIFLTRGEII
jgi:hypothetical protein